MAELAVIIYLTATMHIVLKRRYKSKAGEIDIIATRGNNIIFIEVKARKKKFNADDVISPYQENRIRRSCEFFLAGNKKFRQKNVRFDVFLVSRLSLRHIKDAWQ